MTDETCTCSECKKVKYTSQFKNKQFPDNRTKMCLECREKRKKRNKRPQFDEDGQQLCSNCLKYFDIQEFQNGKFVRCEKCRYQRRNQSSVRRNNPSMASHKLIAFYTQQKQASKCVDCGIEDYRLLEFDHNDTEEKTDCVFRMTTIKSMEEEMKKCEVRCSRCHRMRTCSALKIREETDSMSNHQRRRFQKRQLVDDQKRKIGKCEMCGWFDLNHLYCLDFDHLKPDEKIANVSQLANDRRADNIILNEIAKCRLLCANCHRLHTLEQFNCLHYDNIEY